MEEIRLNKTWEATFSHSDSLHQSRKSKGLGFTANSYEKKSPFFSPHSLNQFLMILTTAFRNINSLLSMDSVSKCLSDLLVSGNCHNCSGQNTPGIASDALRDVHIP